MTLYEIINGIGTYYVVANDPTQAVQKLESRLDAEDYGFTKDRKTKTINVIAEQVLDEPFGLTRKFLLL